jgi:hypothetical protein
MRFRAFDTPRSTRNLRSCDALGGVRDGVRAILGARFVARRTAARGGEGALSGAGRAAQLLTGVAEGCIALLQQLFELGARVADERSGGLCLRVDARVDIGERPGRSCATWP